jgi:O-antigen/teichoic acid export membrane protein
MGAGHVRSVVIAAICGSLINLTLSVILVKFHGLIGVAVAVVVASAVIDLVSMPWLAQRVLGLSIKSYIRSACVRPIAVAVLQLAAVSCARLMGRPAGVVRFGPARRARRKSLCADRVGGRNHRC